jgi:uncharacterized protein YggT (Ycf19 family)
MDSSIAPTTKPLYRGTQIVWYIFGILETLLIFRLILKMLGANPGAGFTDFIYSMTYPFLVPFQSVFNTIVTEESVIEWTTLLAILVYWLLAEAIIRLFLMGKSVSTREASLKLNEQEL